MYVKDIDTIQKSHDHLFQISWKLGNTSFAVKYEKTLTNEESLELFNQMRFRK